MRNAMIAGLILVAVTANAEWTQHESVFGKWHGGEDAFVAIETEYRSPHANLEWDVAVITGQRLSFNGHESDADAPELWTVDVASDEAGNVTTFHKWDVGAVVAWARTVEIPTHIRTIPSQYAMTIRPAYGYTLGDMYAALASDAEGRPDGAFEIRESETPAQPGFAENAEGHFKRNAGRYALGGGGLVGGYALAREFTRDSKKSEKKPDTQKGDGHDFTIAGDVNAPVTIIINESSSGDPINNTGSGGVQQQPAL